MILREIGSYTITSEKLDNIDPWWIDFYGILLLVVIISSFITSIIFCNIVLFIICVVTIVVGIFSYFKLSERYEKFGIDIKLKCGRTIRSKTFIISGNSEKDVAHIKSIVDEFETVAKKMCEEDSKRLKMRNEQKELAEIKIKENCDLYTNIMKRGEMSILEFLVLGVLAILCFLFVSTFFTPMDSVKNLGPGECNDTIRLEMIPMIPSFIINNYNGTFTPIYNKSKVCVIPEYLLPTPNPVFYKTVTVAGIENKWFGDCTIVTGDNQFYSSSNDQTCLALTPGNTVNITLQAYKGKGPLWIIDANIIGVRK